MFRLHRKKGKSRGVEKQTKRTNDSFGIEPSQNVGTLQKAIEDGHFQNPPPEMRNLNGFFDDGSIDSSLYTTPSKTTIQYPARHRPITYGIDWESTQGSQDEGQGTRFTAELALDQYKLGGWQAPPAIELAPTPSTAESSNSSRAISPAPSISRHEEQRQENTTDSGSYNKVFRSGWVKHPQIPTCLHTADYDSLVFEHVRDSYLEAQSAASTEISWHFDSRAYREKLSPEVATPEASPPTVPQNVATNVRTIARDDEESACTSVSSIYTNGFCHDTPRSNISAWSPTASPVDHVILKEDEESSCHDLCDGGASQGAEYDGNEVIDEVSFSELISRCEEESLAERLAPHYPLPPKRLFGTTIDTNSSGSFPDSFTSNLGTEHRNQESAYETKLSTPKENKDGSIVTPKYNDAIPDDSATSHKEELDVPKTEVESQPNDSPTMQSRPEAQNLHVEVELSAPKALTKQHVVHVDSDKENESYKSDEHKILPNIETQETRILVDTNELPTSGVEAQNILDQSDSVTSEKTFHFDTSNDSSIFVPGKKSYYFGPVDLDESFSSSSDEEDASKWRRQSDNHGRNSCVDKAVTQNGFTATISPIAASKRDTRSMSPSQASLFLSEGTPTRHENPSKGRQEAGVWKVGHGVESSPAVRGGSRRVLREHETATGNVHKNSKARKEEGTRTSPLKNASPSKKIGKWNPFTRLKNKTEKGDERNTKSTPTRFDKSRKQSRPKKHGTARPYKGSHEGNLYYSTPVHYSRERSRATPPTTTTRGSDFSANSNLHKDFSFPSPRTNLSLTRSPTTVTTLPPCRLCKTAERTHISLPCMHYSFCSDCAETLQGLDMPTCPICQTQKITLSRVYL